MNNERKRLKHQARLKRREKRAKISANIPKEVKVIDMQLVYYPYRQWQDAFQKYWREGDDTVFKIINSPWALFVEDYLISGDEILKNIDDHVVSKWGFEAFEIAKKNIDNIHPKKMDKKSHARRSANRLINLTKSIKEYGYCGGAYNSNDNLINVIKNYIAPNGNKGFKLLYGNRRAAVCSGLGMKKIKVRCWDYYKTS